MTEKYSKGKDYKVVALVSALYSNEDKVDLTRAIIKKANSANIKIVYFSTLTDFFKTDVTNIGEKTVFNYIDPAKYDAIILMAESFKDDDKTVELIYKAREAHVPVITVDKEFFGCFHFALDYRNSFKLVVKHMIETHHYTKPVFFAGMKGNSFSEERLDVFREVLHDNGILFDPDNVYYGDFWSEPTKREMGRLLEKGIEGFDSIICANDNMALAVVEVLQENGIRVPEDIAVSGFDGAEVADFCSPVLTTSQSNVGALADRLIDYTLKICNRDKPPLKLFFDAGSLRAAESCGCSNCKQLDFKKQVMELKLELNRERRFQELSNDLMFKIPYIDNNASIIGELSYLLMETKYKECYIYGNTNMISYKNFTECPDSEFLTYLHLYNKPEDHYYFEYGSQEIKKGVLLDPDRIFEDNGFIAILPLHSKGDAIGVIEYVYDIDSFEFINAVTFINSFKYFLETAKTKIELNKLYLYDSLTGLYNRNGFYDVINDMIVRNKDRQLSIIALDMDGLKKINDTYGHDEGDRALKAIGSAISAVRDVEDICARVGGDEFLIAFADDENLEVRTKKLIGAIKSQINRLNRTGGFVYELSISVGSYTDLIRNTSLDKFLKNADALMYSEKKRHKLSRK